MKLVIHPPVETARLEKILEVARRAGNLSVVNVEGEVEAAQEIVDAEGLFGKITPSLLASARSLRWVQAPTASLEHYMFPELVEHECELTNMRGLYSDMIGDQVLGYIICFARKLHFYIRNQIESRWEAVGGEAVRSQFVLGPGQSSPIDLAHIHLGDATLGIVGLGSIGSEIARRALACSMRVIAVDPVRETPLDGVTFLRKLDALPQLLQESDFVAIAAPHTPETYKMFGRQQFQQMKPSAYLINIGRGAIVDLADLTEALVNLEVAGAALDVFETEPLPSDHPLWKMDNVIITPHVAGASPRVASRHLEVLLDNIGRFAAGSPLLNVVDKAKWY